MHELGIVSGILDVACKTAREAGASRVVSVTVRIGDMCETVPEAMDFAWEALREEDPLTLESEMIVERVHPRSACVQCGEVPQVRQRADYVAARPRVGYCVA